MSFLVPLLMEHGLTTFFSWPPGKKNIQYEMYGGKTHHFAEQKYVIFVVSA